MTTVVATPGQGPDRPQEVSYTDTKVIIYFFLATTTLTPMVCLFCVSLVKVIGNGSFGVVYQAKLCDSGEMVAIKKVLQDKRFKVIFFLSG